MSLLAFSGCTGGSVADSAGGLTGAAVEVEPGTVEVSAAAANRPPTISNLRFFYTRTSCALGSGGRGWPGVLRFSYRDPDGNIRRGRVEETFRFDDFEPGYNSYSVPSKLSKITGTRSGTIEIGPVCNRFADASVITESITLVDRGGLRSNTLTTTFVRPPGHPLLRQPGEPLHLQGRDPS